MIKKILIGIFFLVLSIRANTNQNYGFDLDWDAYYSSLGWYISFQGETKPFLADEEEYKLYKDLFLHSLIPHFFLLELSVNPLPCVGTALRYYTPNFYDNMTLFEGFNIIKTITSGFEEPGAVSFFLGNLVSFKPKDYLKNWKGKGYAGYLFTIGNYHIKDNILIKDNWIEMEWKIKGDRRTSIKKMSWSYRIGSKLHANPEIKDILFLALKRDRTDFNDFSWSFFKNSSFRYRMDFSIQDLRVIKVLFLLGKKFAIIKNKIAGGIEFGVIWENADKYTGSLQRNYAVDANYQFIIQPQIKF